jgi:orotidine-5'-phosphate decarboxylase
VIKELIVALDFDDTLDAIDCARKLRTTSKDPMVGMVKVGLELYLRGGRPLIKELADMGHHIMLDLKFHDIPNTMLAAVAAASEYPGVKSVTAHIAAGLKAMEAISRHGPLVWGVTVLTSLSELDLEVVGMQRSLSEVIKRRVLLAYGEGLDGIICSARDLPRIRELIEGRDDFSDHDKFEYVCPGIRLAGTGKQDQKRVTTPAQAIKAGAHRIVVGRTITRDRDPVGVVQIIGEEIGRARETMP